MASVLPSNIDAFKLLIMNCLPFAAVQELLLYSAYCRKIQFEVFSKKRRFPTLSTSCCIIPVYFTQHVVLYRPCIRWPYDDLFNIYHTAQISTNYNFLNILLLYILEAIILTAIALCKYQYTYFSCRVFRDTSIQ